MIFAFVEIGQTVQVKTFTFICKTLTTSNSDKLIPANDTKHLLLKNKFL